jgi:hypothetical protein
MVMRWAPADWVGARCVLTSGGGLARVDVADNDDVDVNLLLTTKQAMSVTTALWYEEGIAIVRGGDVDRGEGCCAVVHSPHDDGVVEESVWSL